MLLKVLLTPCPLVAFLCFSSESATTMNSVRVLPAHLLFPLHVLCSQTVHGPAFGGVKYNTSDCVVVVFNLFIFGCVGSLLLCVGFL